MILPVLLIFGSALGHEIIGYECGDNSSTTYPRYTHNSRCFSEQSLNQNEELSIVRKSYSISKVVKTCKVEASLHVHYCSSLCVGIASSCLWPSEKVPLQVSLDYQECFKASHQNILFLKMNKYGINKNVSLVFSGNIGYLKEELFGIRDEKSYCYGETFQFGNKVFSSAVVILYLNVKIGSLNAEYNNITNYISLGDFKKVKYNHQTHITDDNMGTVMLKDFSNIKCESFYSIYTLHEYSIFMMKNFFIFKKSDNENFVFKKKDDFKICGQNVTLTTTDLRNIYVCKNCKSLNLQKIQPNQENLMLSQFLYFRSDSYMKNIHFDEKTSRLIDKMCLINNIIYDKFPTYRVLIAEGTLEGIKDLGPNGQNKIQKCSKVIAETRIINSCSIDVPVTIRGKHQFLDPTTLTIKNTTIYYKCQDTSVFFLKNKDGKVIILHQPSDRLLSENSSIVLRISKLFNPSQHGGNLFDYESSVYYEFNQMITRQNIIDSTHANNKRKLEEPFKKIEAGGKFEIYNVFSEQLIEKFLDWINIVKGSILYSWIVCNIIIFMIHCTLDLSKDCKGISAMKVFFLTLCIIFYTFFPTVYIFKNSTNEEEKTKLTLIIPDRKKNSIRHGKEYIY